MKGLSFDLCRELYGRGLIGSLKATTWWQQLQEKQNKAAQQSAPLKDGVRVQVSPPGSDSPLLSSSSGLPVVEHHDVAWSDAALARRGSSCFGAMPKQHLAKQYYDCSHPTDVRVPQY